MQSSENEPIRVLGAKERLPHLFEAFELILDDTRRALIESRNPATNVEYIRLKTFDRAFNTAKGVSLLLEHDHWELASLLVRQLFELLLNLEEVHRAPDPEAAVIRYMRFAAIQDVRHSIAGLRYDIESGRREALEPPTPSDLETFCLVVFPEFVRRRNGRLRWDAHWSGHNIRGLAQRSRRALRLRQYETVYSMLSAEVHAAPLAVAGGFAELTRDREPTVDERIQDEDYRIAEVMSLASTFFVEVWDTCRPPIGDMTEVVPSALHTLTEALQRHGDPREPFSGAPAGESP